MYGTVESGSLPSVSRSNKKLLAVAMAAGLLVVAVLGTAMLTRESSAPEYDELESYDYAPQEEELAGDDEEQDTDEEDADPVELMQELDNQRQMLDEIETDLVAAAKAPAKAAAKPAAKPAAAKAPAKAAAKPAAKASAAASARHAAHAAHNSGSRI